MVKRARKIEDRRGVKVTFTEPPYRVTTKKGLSFLLLTEGQWYELDGKPQPTYRSERRPRETLRWVELYPLLSKVDRSIYLDPRPRKTRKREVDKSWGVDTLAGFGCFG